MKDLEILENIDLDKILTEMRLRDKKIDRLQHVEDEFENRMENQENRTAHAVKNIEKILAQEREAKNEAVFLLLYCYSAKMSLFLYWQTILLPILSVFLFTFSPLLQVLLN